MVAFTGPDKAPCRVNDPSRKWFEVSLELQILAASAAQ
jgi:hypothetical protein